MFDKEHAGGPRLSLLVADQVDTGWTTRGYVHKRNSSK